MKTLQQRIDEFPFDIEEFDIPRQSNKLVKEWTKDLVTQVLKDVELKERNQEEAEEMEKGGLWSIPTLIAEYIGYNKAVSDQQELHKKVLG